MPRGPPQQQQMPPPQQQMRPRGPLDAALDDALPQHSFAAAIGTIGRLAVKHRPTTTQSPSRWNPPPPPPPLLLYRRKRCAQRAAGLFAQSTREAGYSGASSEARPWRPLIPPPLYAVLAARPPPPLLLAPRNPRPPGRPPRPAKRPLLRPVDPRNAGGRESRDWRSSTIMRLPSRRNVSGAAARTCATASGSWKSTNAKPRSSFTLMFLMVPLRSSCNCSSVSTWQGSWRRSTCWAGRPSTTNRTLRLRSSPPSRRPPPRPRRFVAPPPVRSAGASSEALAGHPALARGAAGAAGGPCPATPSQSAPPPLGSEASPSMTPSEASRPS